MFLGHLAFWGHPSFHFQVQWIKPLPRSKIVCYLMVTYCFEFLLTLNYWYLFIISPPIAAVLSLSYNCKGGSNYFLCILQSTSSSELVELAPPTKGLWPGPMHQWDCTNLRTPRAPDPNNRATHQLQDSWFSKPETTELSSVHHLTSISPRTWPHPPGDRHQLWDPSGLISTHQWAKTSFRNPRPRARDVGTWLHPPVVQN